MQTIFTLLSIIEIFLVIIALIDLFKRKFKNLVFGLVWLFIILMIPIVGAVGYLLLKDKMSADRPRAFNPAFHREEKKGAS